MSEAIKMRVVRRLDGGYSLYEVETSDSVVYGNLSKEDWERAFPHLKIEPGEGPVQVEVQITKVET